MATQFKPADFSRIVELGSAKSHRTGAGLNISEFVSAYTLHYKQQKRTLSQEYTLVGTRLDNSITIIVRHDPRNVDQQLARFNGTDTYDIVECSPDESNDAIRYDYLTLTKITKGA